MTRPDWHRLLEIDEDNRTGVCQVCGPVRLKKRYRKRKNGSDYYRCSKNYFNQKKLQKRPYRRLLKDTCEKCGFVPIHIIQLDIDHIDGNNSNNDPSNLQTLCANCHRLKTFLNRDFDNKKRPPSPKG